MEQILYHLPLFFAVLPFIMGVILLVKSKNKRGRTLMALLQLNVTVLLVCSWFFITKQTAVYAFLYGLNIACLLWIVPLVFSYLIYFVGKKRNRMLLHFVPGFLLGVMLTVYWFVVATPAEKMALFSHPITSFYADNGSLQPLVLGNLIALFAVLLQFAIYSFIFATVIKNYGITLQREYGNVDLFAINWVRSGFLLLAVVYMLIITNQLLEIYRTPYTFNIMQFLFVVVVLFMGIKNMLQRYPILVKKANWNESFEADKEAEQEMLNKLLHLFKTEKPYLEKTVNATDLSEKLNTSRNYLVSVINVRMNMNFNTFVNRYRANYLKKYKAENRNAKNKELMEATGFSSFKAFNDALKRI